MSRRMREILAVLLALLLLVPMAAAAGAEQTGDPSAVPAGAETAPASEEDSGIIDAAALQQWMDTFAAENNLKENYKRFSVGFWYSGTGDSWYYDADQWMYSASLYKVPVSMLMAEKEAAGELTQESMVNGTTLQYLESTALIYSNNDSGHSMVSWLGGTYAGKCSDQTIRFTDLPESYFTQDFKDVSYYTARYMTQVMRTLYLGGEEQFPHVLEYLKQAQPDDYYNRDSTLKASYTIAQKFGAYEEPNGNNNNHCAAVIYTPNPIVVTVMTRNVGGYQDIIAAVGRHLAETALELDQHLEEYRRLEAEKAAQAEQAAMAAQAEQAVHIAAGEQSTEIPDSDAQNAGGQEPLYTEQSTTAAESRSPAGTAAAPKQETVSGASASRGIPFMVWIIAAVLLMAVIAAAVLLRRLKSGAVKDVAEGAEDGEGPDEDYRPPRRISPKTRTNRRTGSDSGYKPRH